MQVLTYFMKIFVAPGLSSTYGFCFLFFLTIPELCSCRKSCHSFPICLTSTSLAFLIFGVGMGISPLYIGLALSASRIVDAVTDPLMGNITDNTKSRWGRRRPYIFLGAILMSIIFASIWFTPRSASELWQATYLIVTCSLFYMAFTIWVIPYSGLGLEMVIDYDERTRLMTFRVFPSYIVGIHSSGNPTSSFDRPIT